MNSTTSLKRTRSVDAFRKFDSTRVPPLPRINTDLALQVFTHRSLRRPNATSPADYGDNERLQQIGRAAFETAVVFALFCRRPFLQASELDKHARYLLSSGMVDDWVACYKLRPKLICDPAVLPLLDSPQEIRSLFHAYVGGLFLFSGPQAVNDWISRLLEQELESIFGVPMSEGDDRPTIEVPPPKRARSETLFMTPKVEEIPPPPIFFASQPPTTPPPPPAFSSVYTPPKPTPPNPLAPAQPNLPFLPLFNQTAFQRRVTVEYLAELTGPSHAGRWRVKCIVNGISKGEGFGSTKQMAKEEAARQAYYSMGWT